MEHAVSLLAEAKRLGVDIGPESFFPDVEGVS